MRTATATAAFEPTEAWQLALAADATVDVLKVDDAAPAREGPRAERLRPAAGGPAARLRDRHGAAAAGGHGPADVSRPRPPSSVAIERMQLGDNVASMAFGSRRDRTP